ncbi:23502_t:CDS:2 [Entrophospora sp. SA101]|nr:23502_t:CDS:2 [Entrophospora sp. SA101]
MYHYKLKENASYTSKATKWLIANSANGIAVLSTTRDNSPQNLKEPFDLNNPPVKRISLRRQSLSHEPFALDTTLPSSSSEIQPSESTGLVRSRTLPSKRPKYSENRNSNSATRTTLLYKQQQSPL